MKRDPRPRGSWVMTQRQLWAARMPVACPRCGLPVTADQPWDLGHRIPLADAPQLARDPDNLHPEHRRCNQAGGATVARPGTSRGPGRLRDYGWR